MTSRYVCEKKKTWCLTVKTETSWDIIIYYNLILSRIWKISTQRHIVHCAFTAPFQSVVTQCDRMTLVTQLCLMKTWRSHIYYHIYSLQETESSPSAEQITAILTGGFIVLRESKVRSSPQPVKSFSELDCAREVLGPFIVFGEICSPFTRSQHLRITSMAMASYIAFLFITNFIYSKRLVFGHHKPFSKLLASARPMFSWTHTWSMSVHTSRYHLPGDKGPFSFCTCYVSREVWPVSQWISIPVSPALVC